MFQVLHRPEVALEVALEVDSEVVAVVAVEGSLQPELQLGHRTHCRGF